MRRGRALDTSAARRAFEPDYVCMVSGFGWWVVSVGVWGGLMRRGRALDTLAARLVFAPDVCDMVLGGGCSGLGVGFSVWGWRVPGPGTSAARHAFAPDYWLWYIWSQLLGFGFGLLEFGVQMSAPLVAADQPRIGEWARVRLEGTANQRGQTRGRTQSEKRIPSETLRPKS